MEEIMETDDLNNVHERDHITQEKSIETDGSNLLENLTLFSSKNPDNIHEKDHNTQEKSIETCGSNLFEYPTLFSSKTLIELCNSSWTPRPKTNSDTQPYIRGCKWSPDGTCCLSVVNNDGVHVTELPRDLYEGSATTDRSIDVLDSVIHVKEAGLVYDFCWYPSMNSGFPETCCWLTTRQNAPIQMWDAFDGSLRCSYRGFNSVDEMEPAVSISFVQNGSRIVAGYKKVIRTFDVNRPGRDFAEHKISAPASCFASDSNLLAIGSWNTSISLYNMTDMGTYKSIGKMHGHSGGVTHMKFTPDGLKLVSGARKDNKLLVWDIRYYRTPLNILHRAVDTNQRIYFDISTCGKYLVTGGTDGVLKVWDFNVVEWKSSIDIDEKIDNVTYKFPLHNDCCNSVSIHPYRPILATGSGQYHLIDPLKDLEETTIKKEPNLDSHCEVANIGANANNTADAIAKTNEGDVKMNDIDMKYSSDSENSLVFWWIGDVNQNMESNIC